MRFRPCIDLHDGKVKQIVGSTLVEGQAPQTNFASSLPPAHYAGLYQNDQLYGGHIIQLGPNNESAATEALATWPGGMQLGGGVTAENAVHWLELGASHVIVTSYVFHDGLLDRERLRHLNSRIGKERLVLDLSCRRQADGHYYVVTDRWQRFTQLRIEPATLEELAGYCAEFLVHAVDVEGKCMGIDAKLLELLATSSPLPTTYAGGVSSMHDLEQIASAGLGRIDATVGSALDIFGGKGLSYREVVRFHEQHC